MQALNDYVRIRVGESFVTDGFSFLRNLLFRLRFSSLRQPEVREC